MPALACARRNPKIMTLPVPLTPLERALLRLLVSGYTLEEASPSLGLSLPEARRLLTALGERHGVSSDTRLIVLAVLNSWV